MTTKNKGKKSGSADSKKTTEKSERSLHADDREKNSPAVSVDDALKDQTEGTEGTADSGAERMNDPEGGECESISFLTDMDGVLIKEGELIPGADEFLNELRDNNIEYMVLTNNSIYTPRDLSARLARTGVDIPAERIWTSAKATASFLSSQKKVSTAYAVGESGLTTALHEIGWVLTDTDPEYVVLGETRTYSFEAITTAIRLIKRGAKFICTNPDITGPSPEGILPATGAVAALIQTASGKKPYYVGKPNPMMMRSALRRIGAHSENTIMVGDRMDTDMKAGMEAGMRTILVRSGISTDDTVEQFPYRPTRVIDSVKDLVGHVKDPFH